MGRGRVCVCVCAAIYTQFIDQGKLHNIRPEITLVAFILVLFPMCLVNVLSHVMLILSLYG